MRKAAQVILSVTSAKEHVEIQRAESIQLVYDMTNDPNVRKFREMRLTLMR